MQRLLITVLLAACSSTPTTPTTVDATDVPDASTAPTLSVTPSATTVTRGEAITFTLAVTNFKIVNPMQNSPKDGEGHYHYYLDDATKYTAGWTPTLTFPTSTTMAPGAHVLHFVLATGTHEEVMPRVYVDIDFTLE